jgi:hypothetical protein
MDLLESGLVCNETSPAPSAPSLHPSGAGLTRTDAPKDPATRGPMARPDAPISTKDGFWRSAYMPRSAAIATGVQFRHAFFQLFLEGTPEAQRNSTSCWASPFLLPHPLTTRRCAAQTRPLLTLWTYRPVFSLRCFPRGDQRQNERLKRRGIIPVFQARRVVCVRAETPPRVAAWRGAIRVECGTVSLRYMG